MNLRSRDCPSATRLLPELVWKQADSTPDAIAIVDPQRELSYAELVRRADAVAAHVRAVVGPADGIVGLCLTRSVELVVALLGTWRAGAAYLPLDPAHPRDRLARGLEDSGVDLVLSDTVSMGVTADLRVTTTCVDRELPEAPAIEVGARGTDLCGASAAYAIYTSGSTGSPKGVLVTHEGIANRALWTVAEHRLGETDRVLHKTPLTFDASCWEILAPLVSGGTVVLAPAGAERDPTALVRAIADSGATVLQVVPSVLRLLVDEPDWSGCEALRLVLCAGEPLRAELCQQLLERVNVEVWNTYGPTECSIDATAHRFDPAQLSGPVSIGRPIDNIEVLLLDPVDTPVAVGVPGEIHLGGAGIARGYAGEPSLTAGAFVPNPFSERGSRVYRTGDLARWSADGTLEFLGRLDDQMKINGVRIEPGEVESALLRHPAVRGAVATAVVGTAGAQRLAAYVVGPAASEAEKLRLYLRTCLPESMIPSALTVLDTFPTTSSGKVDRRALPLPDDPGADRPPYCPPGNPAERTVVHVWSALLDVEPIGLHDHFFQLGGTSLLITRLANGLQQATGAEIAVPDLYYAPTVEAQAKLVTTGGRELGSIRPLPRPGPHRLSVAQTRQWFLDRLQPGSTQWLAPMLLGVPADTAVAVVQQAVDLLEARHESLRTRYDFGADGEPMQAVEPPLGVRVRVLEASTGDDLVQLLRQEFATGFDLARGRLIRATLVRRPAHDSILVLTMHHIACDGWSTVVIESEFRELCAAISAGREPRLPAPSTQYADFAAWQREWLTDERMSEDLAYWRRSLAGISTLELPQDRPRPDERDHRGLMESFHVPADIAEQLVEVGRRRRATPFMTFLAAFGVLLSRYCGQDDIAVGVPVSGRLHPDVAGVVGFFVNPLVLRCDLSGNPSFLATVDRVRDASVSGFAHQVVPFDRIVDELVTERDASRNPLYQVEFDMHDEGWTGTAVEPDVMAAFREAWGVARTDLCLYLQRHGDGSMTGIIEYAEALFDRDRIARLADHYVRLLTRVGAAPAAQVHTVSFLHPQEGAVLVDPDHTCVLDRHRNLAPVGVPGEVHAVDSIHPSGGRQLRSTGRLGVRRAGGGLELLGRVDEVARVRGTWVDLRGVEAALTACGLVGDAVVVANGPTLRALWTAQDPTDRRPAREQTAELVAHCRTLLLPHQVPGSFVRVAAIPRPNGTVDRRTLADLDGGEGPEPGRRRPLGPTESAIAQIWRGLLRVEVQPDTSFFSLGGNSILAIRMIAAISDEFGVDVPIRAFFEHATIASLAEEVEARIRAELAELSDADVLAELKRAGDPA